MKTDYLKTHEIVSLLSIPERLMKGFGFPLFYFILIFFLFYFFGGGGRGALRAMGQERDNC